MKTSAGLGRAYHEGVQEDHVARVARELRGKEMSGGEGVR